MKKLGLLVMPLMAMSLLMSCGGNNLPFDPLKIDLYKKENIYDETGENIICITKYEYNIKRLIKKMTTTYPESPNDKDVYKYTYDKYENETELHYVSYDGKKIVDEGWTVTEYTYDEQNRVTKHITTMSFDNVEWINFEHYEYEYHENITIKKDFGINDSLDSTTTYTYDENGNLISEKIIHSKVEGELELIDQEKVYEVDENGCTIKIVCYDLKSSGERDYCTSVTEITYLNNLWYRPLKEVTAFFVEGEVSGYMTYESVYDSKNRIKLYKIYDGTEEGPTPSYVYYSTYEY